MTDQRSSSDTMMERVAKAIDDAVTGWQPGSGISIKEAAARAAIEAVNGDAQAGWMPIGTAPKDGTRLILAWDDSTSLPMHWEVGHYRSGTGAGSGWCNTYGHSFGGNPTHWMQPSASALSSTK